MRGEEKKGKEYEYFKNFYGLWGRISIQIN